VGVSVEEQEILDKIREVVHHGHGQVVVFIQDRVIQTVSWQKTQKLYTNPRKTPTG
jgi:ribulose bisphosphate carboxylase small subunit